MAIDFEFLFKCLKPANYCWQKEKTFAYRHVRSVLISVRTYFFTGTGFFFLNWYTAMTTTDKLVINSYSSELLRTLKSALLIIYSLDKPSLAVKDKTETPN